MISYRWPLERPHTINGFPQETAKAIWSLRRLALERPHGEGQHADEPDDRRRRDCGQAERGPATEREPNRLGRREGNELRVDRARGAEAYDLRASDVGLETGREEDGRVDEGADWIDVVEGDP